MNADISAIVAALEGKRSGDGWLCNCPAHDDHSRHLSVTEKDGKTLFHCNHGCDQGAVVAALKDRSLWPSGNGEERTDPREETYIYRDAEGREAYRKNRFYKPGDPEKHFAFWHMEGGKLVKDKGTKESLLYRLPELLAALHRGETVYVTEGEKDAETLVAWGLVATCNDGGAKNWKAVHASHFPSGAKVKLVPDNDEAGKVYIRDVVRTLTARGVEVEVARLDAKDVTEWKEAGHSKEDFLWLDYDEPGAGLILSAEIPPAGETPHEILPYPLTTLEQIYNAPPPEYGIEGLLHKNTLNLIDSLPGVGKTLWCLELAAAISQPDDFPFLGAFKVHWPPGSRVLIVDQENGATDLSSRLQGMKVPTDAPICFLHFAGVQLDKEESFARLLLTVQQLQPVLIVFDSLIRLHGVKESSSDEMAPVMGRLRELVNLGCTVIAQHHQGWGAERSRGSTDIQAAVDFEFTLVRRGPESDPYMVLSTPKARRAPIDPIRLKISAEDGPVRMLYLGPDVVTKIDLDAEILRCVSEGDGRTFDEIAAWMKDKGIRACESVLRSAVKGLVGGKVKETAGKHNRKIYSSLVVPN